MAVVIADDHDLYRRSMTTIIQLDPGVRVVGQARTGIEAVEVCARVHPDVVLMDVRMPAGGGIEACRRIRRRAPSTRILMLTMSDDERDLAEAVKAGASGYLFKDVPGEHVTAALRRVHRGEVLISPRVAAMLLRELGADGLAGLGLGFDESQIDLLRLVARGLDSDQIAEVLGLRVEAVNGLVAAAIAKLQRASERGVPGAP